MVGGIIGSIVSSAAAPLANAAAAVLPGVLDIVKKYIPDPEKQAQIQLELTTKLLDAQSEENQAIARIAEAQAAINLEEAKSESVWKSGWRSAAAWCCVAGLAYSFVVQPILGWGATMLGAAIAANVPSPPVLNMEVLISLLGGLLGLGTFRTVEKVSGAEALPPTAPLRRANPVVIKRT